MEHMADRTPRLSCPVWAGRLQAGLCINSPCFFSSSFFTTITFLWSSGGKAAQGGDEGVEAAGAGSREEILVSKAATPQMLSA